MLLDSESEVAVVAEVDGLELELTHLFKGLGVAQDEKDKEDEREQRVP